MKKLLFLFILLTLNVACIFAQEAKIASDCTVYYTVNVEDAKADASVVKAMAQTYKTLYIKGSRSRSDLETTNFKQIMLFDTKTDSTTILRELAHTKYISFLNSNERKEKYKKYEGINFTKTAEKKTIVGYDCEKVIANLANGTSYNIFYTTSIVPSTTEYEYQFKDLPGLVLEYEAEFEHGKTKVIFTASKISLLPVPAAKFDIPKTGYRVL